MIFIRSAAEQAIMRRAGRVVAETLEVARQAIRPGVTTAELDALVDSEIRRRGARPSFKGLYDFPASACISVNEEVVHGVPSARVLQPGDIVTIDVGAYLDGYHADGAWTFPVGSIGPEARRALDVAETALYVGIAQVKPDALIASISHAVQSYVEGQGMNLARKYDGHGVGRELHEPPAIPNWIDPQAPPPRRTRLKPGMVFTIEPVVITGGGETVVRPDNWTVVTADGSLAAHFEHSLVVMEAGAQILTAL